MPATPHEIPGPKSPQVRATGFSHGLLPGKVAGFPCSLSPCLLQPLRVVHVGGNPPIFTSASLDGRALGKRLPSCNKKSRKPIGRGVNGERELFRKREELRGEKNMDRHSVTKPGNQGSVDTGSM